VPKSGHETDGEMELSSAMPRIVGLLLSLNLGVIYCYYALKKINNNLVHAMGRLPLLGDEPAAEPSLPWAP
jgi:hypothetical protein